ncbi:MAG TPA: hypothetical protein PKY77_10220 [Phycisphaerae bacterium]|nr:hypothetical protein [Phycisphaerae bacterium]HRY69953.1 hypothetical protein [Phycisphaerae bacterium]HSA27162.1 hypothetical protein [Phycisphaerae bacterium]
MFIRVVLASSLTLALLSGCGGPGWGGLFGGPQKTEKWRIRCYHREGPNHEETCKQVASLLGQVKDLQARKIQVVTTPKSSTVYYGEYVKVPSASGERLVFPPDYLRDMDLIQRVVINQTPLFRMAKPELVTTGTAIGGGEWEVVRCPGTHTLQIGVFYSTPTFQERREAAEEYVKLLREEGFSAYYWHEDAKSFVFVGDFDESDLIHTAQGIQFGPRVEQLIARRPEEFRYTLENLHRVKRTGLSGEMTVPPSILVPVPRNRSADRDAMPAATQ